MDKVKSWENTHCFECKKSSHHLKPLESMIVDVGNRRYCRKCRYMNQDQVDRYEKLFLKRLDEEHHQMLLEETHRTPENYIPEEGRYEGDSSDDGVLYYLSFESE